MSAAILVSICEASLTLLSCLAARIALFKCSSPAASAASTALSTAISTEVVNRNAAILALDNDLQGQIDALAGVNSQEVVATFLSTTSFDAGVVFNIAGGHVAVFVNGLQIHEAAEGIDGWRSVDGKVFTVEGLGYDLEANDHIIVSGTLAA